MVEFKPLELKDRNIFMRCLNEYRFSTYEYSFATLYLWRKYCNVEYAIINDAIVIKKTEDIVGTYFMEPIGYTSENIKGIVECLMELKKKDSNIKCLFRDIEESFLGLLKELFPNEICMCEDINNFDYIYDRKELMSLSGNRLHKKRNHYNQFISNYNYSVKDITDEGVARDCIDFATAWNNSRGSLSEQLLCELEGIKDILKNSKELNLQGMAVYIDDKIEGFTIGERVSDKMSIIHIEKADAEYRGIYAFINKTFIEKYYSDIEFINREEDLGVEGLREAKQSYHPVRLEKKYIVNVGPMRGEFILTTA